MKRMNFIRLTICIMCLGFTGICGARELTDQAISNTINGELIADQAVDSNWIDVVTVDSVVTLSGHVDNILSKRRAAKLAKTVRGVRSVVNRIEVAAPARDDNALERDIQEAMIWDPAVESIKIGVSAHNGRITLTGTVGSWQERQLTEKIAMGIRGVKSVDNNINIDYQTNRSDFELEEEIRKRLQWDAYVDDGLIEVSVDDGRVDLSGTVGSAAEKDHAVTDAWVTGVESVNADDLDIEKWARDDRFRKEKFVTKEDSRIEEAVRDALMYDIRVNAYDVDVSSQAGIVTLSGSVNYLKAKRAAEMDAKNTVGVWKVRNLLTVRPDETTVPTDTTIENRIENALLNDPYVERSQLNVSVINNVVYLSGMVDNYFQKGQAEDVASRIYGVVRVENDIRVEEEDNPLTYDPYVYPYWSVYSYPWYGYPGDITATETDWDIRENIQSELWWSPFVDEDEVNVSVKDGVATLTGKVDTWNEYLAARENAYEGGAVQVKNRLDVEYGPQE